MLWSSCLAMPSTSCHATTSVWLPALTGAVGAFDGPLSFSDSSDSTNSSDSIHVVIAMPRHALHVMLCHDFQLLALTGAVGAIDGPLSYLDPSDY